MSQSRQSDPDVPASPAVIRAIREADLFDAVWRPLQPPDAPSSQLAATAAVAWPNAAESSTPAPPSSAAPDRRPEIPGYLFISEIHRGGQGVVYHAIQESTQRDVAIKLLHRAGAARPRDRQRFELEVQVLRELNHPNIVTVLDMGEIDGRQFLVMPFVESQPLDHYVAEAGLNVPQTLELFARVCDAVAAAHLAGVIHRDIKPGNILIDDADTPFVVDFGLAKLDVAAGAPACRSGREAAAGTGVPDAAGTGIPVAAGTGIPDDAGTGIPDDAGTGIPDDAGTGIPSGSPTAGTGIPSGSPRGTGRWQLATDTLTEPGQFIGSLPWASPEQAEGIPGTIDLRTDVYSLGAVLYSLLTGRYPIDPSGSQREVLNRIVTAEPLRCGTAALKCGAAVPGYHLPAGWIASDVETIVHKCLEKNPTRRYQSAGDLAADIRRCLAGEPIEAKRDSRWYVARKFLRRNWLPASITASWLGSMMVACVALFVFWRQAESEKVAREAAYSQLERENRKARNADYAAQVLQNSLKASVSGILPQNVHEAVTITDAFVRRIPTQSVGNPELEVRLRQLAAHYYAWFEQLTNAREQLEIAVPIARSAFGMHHERYAETIEQLAEVTSRQLDYPGAARLYQQSLDIWLGLPEDRSTQIADSEAGLLSALLNAGELAAAEPRMRKFLQKLDCSDPTSALRFRHMAERLSDLGRHTDALPLQEKGLSIARATGDEPQLGDSLHSYGVLLREIGRLTEAEVHQREALKIRERIYPQESERHFCTYVTKASLAFTLTLMGEFAEAEELLLNAEANYAPPRIDAAYREVEIEIVERLVILYERWDAAAPAAGHAESAAQWRSRSKKTLIINSP